LTERTRRWQRLVAGNSSAEAVADLIGDGGQQLVGKLPLKTLFYVKTERYIFSLMGIPLTRVDVSEPTKPGCTRCQCGPFQTADRSVDDGLGGTCIKGIPIFSLFLTTCAADRVSRREYRSFRCRVRQRQLFTKGNIMSKSSKSAARSPMTQSAAARIQSVGARTNGGKVSAGSFAARAQAAAAHNATGKTGSGK